MMRSTAVLVGVALVVASLGACTVQEDVDDLDRLALEDDDEDLDALSDRDERDPEDQEVVEADEDLDALVDPDEPLEDPGDPCSISDSNGPLPGGTMTTTGCDEGEVCFPVACAGYSCFGFCQAGGGFPGGGGFK